MKKLNIKELYNQVKVIKLEDVQYEITYFNISVFELIKEMLEGGVRIDTLSSSLWEQFIILIRASETSGIKGEDILAAINEDSKALMQEFKTHKDPIRAMCYLIGTNSEIPQNYTMTERMIIVTAMLRFYGLNLIF